MTTNMVARPGGNVKIRSRALATMHPGTKGTPATRPAPCCYPSNSVKLVSCSPSCNCPTSGRRTCALLPKSSLRVRFSTPRRDQVRGQRMPTPTHQIGLPDLGLSPLCGIDKQMEHRVIGRGYSAPQAGLARMLGFIVRQPRACLSRSPCKLPRGILPGAGLARILYPDVSP